MRGARSSFLLCSIFLILYYIMSKTVVQSFSAHLARFSPTRCARLFPALQAENEFSVLRTGMRFLQPPLLFLSAKESKKEAHLRAKSLAALGCAPKRACGRSCGCRRKRVLFAFGLPSNPNRCSASFRKALLLLRAPPERRCGREKLCT